VDNVNGLIKCYHMLHGLLHNVFYIVDIEFLTKMNIDYVCHDDIPYITADTDDAYALCKKLGKFKATKRT
jgi:choline-phosphate cytidylyltransferase